MDKYIEKYGSYKLCYVENNKAYFTRFSLDNQWGDDWGDAPYEHNAGEPYCQDEDDIFSVYVESGNNCSEIEPPNYHFTNSPYSVEDINNREVPWLQYKLFDSIGNISVQLFAGITFEEFAGIVREHKGIIYCPEV